MRGSDTFATKRRSAVNSLSRFPQSTIKYNTFIISLFYVYLYKLNFPQLILSQWNYTVMIFLLAVGEFRFVLIHGDIIIIFNGYKRDKKERNHSTTTYFTQTISLAAHPTANYEHQDLFHTQTILKKDKL